MSWTSAAFGRHIRAARLEKGMTQEELSMAAGLSVSFVGGIERGIKSPTLDSAQKLCSALGTSAGRVLLHCEAELSNDRRDRLYSLLNEYGEKILLELGKGL